MLLVDSDLVEAMMAAARGDLADTPLAVSPKAAVTVMAVSAGYPGSYAKGKVITGLDKVDSGTIPFHAGTKIDADGQLVTSGGRVIAFSSMADTVQEALDKSFRAIGVVDFDGKNFRRDIGRDLLNYKG